MYTRTHQKLRAPLFAQVFLSGDDNAEKSIGSGRACDVATIA